MTELMTTTGNLVDMKYQKTTGCLRVIIDVEPEMANEAHVRLGGYPKPHESRHVAIAVMQPMDEAQTVEKNPLTVPEFLRR